MLSCVAIRCTLTQRHKGLPALAASLPVSSDVLTSKVMNPAVTRRDHGPRNNAIALPCTLEETKAQKSVCHRSMYNVEAQVRRRCKKNTHLSLCRDAGGLRNGRSTDLPFRCRSMDCALSSRSLQRMLRAQMRSACAQTKAKKHCD